MSDIVQTNIVEENDAEERTLLGINIEYVCSGCGEQVIIYNLTKEHIIHTIVNVTSIPSTEPSRTCMLENIKMCLVAVMDQDQVTIQETITIKEIES
ncbi:hypothetical protein SEA_EUGENEKRABS_21 [Microbacterium phage EugeneKrabs]|nr:hypothetical protein SEA_EUGENEKRABS_21 [Microbacterium phage EugeneKrabs]